MKNKVSFLILSILVACTFYFLWYLFFFLFTDFTPEVNIDKELKTINIEISKTKSQIDKLKNREELNQIEKIKWLTLINHFNELEKLEQSITNEKIEYDNSITSYKKNTELWSKILLIIIFSLMFIFILITLFAKRWFLTIPLLIYAVLFMWIIYLNWTTNFNLYRMYSIESTKMEISNTNPYKEETKYDSLNQKLKTKYMNKEKYKNINSLWYISSTKLCRIHQSNNYEAFFNKLQNSFCFQKDDNDIITETLLQIDNELDE